MADGVPVHDLQAVAHHLFSYCSEQREAFSECMETKTKNSDCNEQYKAMMSCAKDLIKDAASKAAEEFKEYSSCLDITGKYAYCQEEQGKFYESFPVDKAE